MNLIVTLFSLPNKRLYILFQDKLKEREKELRKRKEREEQEMERVKIKVRRKEAEYYYRALLVEIIKDPKVAFWFKRFARWSLHYLLLSFVLACLHIAFSCILNSISHVDLPCDVQFFPSKSQPSLYLVLYIVCCFYFLAVILT